MIVINIAIVNINQTAKMLTAAPNEGSDVNEETQIVD